ncbi:MAG: UDPglucose--hexose-phosphate uridylyltransferase [Frankiales bacterium]|nr:UDPglucose--hexose-phosphate uridylyltransferase [Frankiales bacterium]
MTDVAMAVLGAAEGGVSPTVFKTLIRLSDGRELFYFDEVATDRSARDTRDLPATETNSLIRLDPVLDEWTVVASHRQSRTYLPPADECPLDPSTAERPTEIPASSYDVVVFENRFPSLAQGSVAESIGGAAPSFFASRPGNGRCEVVCFTSDHNSSFSALPFHRVRLVMDMWADRTAALSALPGVELVFPFENRGEEIGVTLHHPHGQIYAYPFLAPRVARQIAVAREHLAQTGKLICCEVVAAESAEERVVGSSEHWVAFVPFAARWPYEVHLYPRRHVADLTELTSVERDEFSVLYPDVLRRFDKLFDKPMPYISAWNQAPVHQERELGHLHLELFSSRRSATKLKFLAGSESAMGVFVNDVTPEDAARMLRDAL